MRVSAANSSRHEIDSRWIWVRSSNPLLVSPPRSTLISGLKKDFYTSEMFWDILWEVKYSRRNSTSVFFLFLSCFLSFFLPFKFLNSRRRLHRPHSGLCVLFFLSCGSRRGCRWQCHKNTATISRRCRCCWKRTRYLIHQQIKKTLVFCFCAFSKHWLGFVLAP